jgi:hypothetical protein
MKKGRILSIDSLGIAQVQLNDRVLEARIVTGDAHIGDRVSGPMESGIQTWTCPLSRRIVVQVLPQSAPKGARNYATM